jgi:uncharacterized membrane protein
MVSEFIYKYYIDPIRYGQPYTLIDTITYAVILILAVYLVYRGLRRTGIAIDQELVLATIPYVVFGGLLRVVQDTGMITSDLQYLLVTPIIFFVIFAYTIPFLFTGRYLEKAGHISRYSLFYGGAGVATCIVTAAVLIAFGLTESLVALDILAIILAMTAASSFAVWVFLKYALKWDYVSNPLYKLLIIGHMLDASATSYGIDLHDLTYVEQHVVGGNLIEWTGTAFAMYPLKLVVIVPAIYILEAYRKEGSPALWHLIVLAMIVVGLAPGIRGLVRMMLYV